MIDYRLTKSKRKTIGVTVKDGTVFVHAPMYVSKLQIDTFVEQNREWIEKKLTESKAKQDRFSDFTQYKRFLYRGKVIPVAKSSNGKVVLNDTALFLPQTVLTDALLKAIAKEYKKQAKLYLSKRLDELSLAAGLPYMKFSLTSAKGKWGSCSSDKAVRLNWRLIFLPDYLADYVIIHELCHTKHMNHSSEFWKLVQAYMPDCKQRRKVLKQQSPLIKLFS